MEHLDDKVRDRLERVARALKAARFRSRLERGELPTIEAARDKLLPSAPAVPAGMGRRQRRRGGGRRDRGRRRRVSEAAICRRRR